jgi:hypothetical protein
MWGPPRMPTDTATSYSLDVKKVEEILELREFEIHSLISNSKSRQTIARPIPDFDVPYEFVLDAKTTWHDPKTNKDIPAIARVHTYSFKIMHTKEGFEKVRASWILVYFPRTYSVICSLRLDCYWTLATIPVNVYSGGL